VRQRGALMAGNIIVSMEEETKIIILEQDFVYTTESQQLRE